MYKEAQFNRVNFCTEIVNSTDTENLKKSFIETLNHDLKTPIIAQIRALGLMLSGSFGELNNNQHEMIQLTLESCNYMYEMVSTLISTYKFDIEEFELNYSYFNIMQLIEETVKHLQSYLTDSHIKIVIIPEIKTPIIAGDLIRMEKVIQTLLFNSLNSAFKNSILKIYLFEDNENITVKMESRSGYIPPEKMDKRFKFYTSHTEKFDKIGTGIGLYLVKKIIEKHKGQIIADSSIDQKNILGFEIPMEAPICLYKDCI